MHTVHIIALAYRLDTEPNTQKVEELLELSLGEESSWWDYYVLGGRWDGYFGEDRNYISYASNPAEVLTALKSAQEAQDTNFRSFRDSLAGATVAVADVSGHIFGLPVQPDQAAADRLTASNKETLDAWQRVLKADTINDIARDFQAQWALYRAGRIVSLVNGEWNPDSMFYDTINQVSDTNVLLNYLSQTYRQGEEPQQGLVLAAVDFHY